MKEIPFTEFCYNQLLGVRLTKLSSGTQDNLFREKF